MDDIGSLQGIGFLMAGTENITNDYIEVPSRPLRSNAVKLLGLERRSNEINEEQFDLEQEARQVASGLEKYILFLFACTGGISINLTSKIPSAAAFAISILSMCLFLAGSILHIVMAKSRIKTMNMLNIFLMETYKNVRDEARGLMELEQNRKGRLAANAVDNSEGPVMDMDSFIARTMTIYDDATEFSDFEKFYHKMIYVSWAICGGIFIPAVLVMSFCNYYYGENSSSPAKAVF